MVCHVYLRYKEDNNISLLYIVNKHDRPLETPFITVLLLLWVYIFGYRCLGSDSSLATAFFTFFVTNRSSLPSKLGKPLWSTKSCIDEYTFCLNSAKC